MPEIIDIPSSESMEDAAKRFAFQADAIIFLFGSLDSTLSPEVRSVFARALLPVALYANALIVDNGASDGLAALLAQAAQELDKSPTLLGILPAQTGNADPNHSAIMRLPAEWPNPAKSSFALTASLAQSNSPDKRPVIALLVGGGGDSDKFTALRCARDCWPLLVMSGTGGLANTILGALTSPPPGATPQPIADPALREILDTGSITALPLDGDTDTLKRLLLGPVQKPGDILADVWARYDDLDLASVDKQRLFRRNQVSILFLTVVITFMAIVSTFVIPARGAHPSPAQDAWGKALHYLMIALPIGLSLLVGFNARFREGNKWILLRAGAESIKQHIFRYRTRSGAYSADHDAANSAPSILAANIRDITSNLMQSEANKTSLQQRSVQDTHRTKFLSADDYLHDRVEDQINYFVSKTQKLHRQLKKLQLWILVAGGLSTLLAAIELDRWVALTTALATAFASKLELDQVENSLVQYNTALMSLRNIQSWWKGLSPWEKTRRNNIDLLVDQTETILDHETAGWVQKMQSTLEKLTEKESSADNQSQPTKQPTRNPLARIAEGTGNSSSPTQANR